MTQITANGILLEYETHGLISDQAMILVRGLGTQLIDWPVPMLQALVKEGFYVVVFDNRDVGLSEKFIGHPQLGRIVKGEEQPTYKLDDMALDIVGLMDALDIIEGKKPGGQQDEQEG